ncbi:MAG: formate/nitrite transporter family protein [Bacilli bacterium]
MEHESVQYLIELAKKKKKTIDNSLAEFMTRAMLAGIYIGFAIIVCFKLGQSLHAVDSPLTYFGAASLFGIALILIIYGGAELFTGNTLYFTVATLNGDTRLSDLGKNWVATYLGNFIGALLFALLFYYSGVFKGIPDDHFLFQIAHKKMDATTMQLFVKGILCNWLVCLACYLPYRVKGDGPKIAIMMLIVYAFFMSGYEHSIANLSIFSLALVLPHPVDITVAGALHNLIPVTIGNIIGGSVFVGMVYYFMNRKHLQKAKQEGLQDVSSKTKAS